MFCELPKLVVYASLRFADGSEVVRMFFFFGRFVGFLEGFLVRVCVMGMEG